MDLSPIPVMVNLQQEGGVSVLTPQPIRAVLESSGLSVKEVSKRAGVSPGTVYRAIKQSPLSIESMEALAYAFRLSVNDIIWGRRPGLSTKPIGTTGPSTEESRRRSERKCNVHNEYFPGHLECCPLCE